ncbi:MAG: hypothetical protein NZ555_13345 [Geminicoccaceae bacterium]|nr:hypothetical protein [Geminicoccaceae bacterium]
MRVTAIETLRAGAFGNLLWLRLETDAGLEGLGEAFRNAEATEAYVHETLAPELLGRDPRELAAHRERIGRVIANRFMGTPSRSIELRGDAALDIALWDLLAKSLDAPLWRLWGGPVRERIRVYNTCAGPAYNTAPVLGWASRLAEPGASALGPLDDLQAQLDDPGGLARSLLAEGVTALKIWPFDRFARATGGNAIGPRELEAGLAPVRAIREAVGEDVEILIECHGLWRLPAAVAIARALLWNARLLIMDEPTAALGVRETAEVRALIRGLEAQGVAVLLVSHDMQDVVAVAHRVAVLRKGRLVALREAAGLDADRLARLVMTAEAA